jgi:hypothetical protein
MQAAAAMDEKREEEMAGQTYTLNFKNNSSNDGDVCLYQTSPNLDMPNAMSLAWLARSSYPGMGLQIQWQIEYAFVWGETGELVPGVVFRDSETLPAGLQGNNQVTLTFNQSYSFINQTAGPTSGSLYISEDSTVPFNQAAVGISMSGSGTFVVPAQPDMELVFKPTPTYWITFGNYIQGQVLDAGSMASSSAQIEFPPGVYTVTAVLNPDNTWTVSPAS